MRDEFMSKAIKHILDFIVSFLLLIALAPLFVVIALFIKLEDKGPAFFKQPRLGLNGQTFLMYKFRSMKVNAPDLRSEDGGTFNAEDDPRVTRIGHVLRKTSLDELPQIINILKAEMSFVGPRPDLPDQISLYHEEDRVRLTVRPGITGYAQVVGRNNLGFRERFKYDIEYVNQYSLWFDFKILVQTVLVVLKRDNVNRSS